MANMKEHLEPLVKALEDYQQKIKADGLVLLKAAFADFFERYPKIEEFSWPQYTPYFNDGDACVFSVATYSIRFKLEGRYEREEADYELSEDEIGAEDAKMVKAAYRELSRALEAVEDTLQAVFGDHAEIIVNREEVRVESYDHE